MNVTLSLRKLRLSEKGAFAQLWQAAIGLGIFVLVIALVSLMTGEVNEIAQDQYTEVTTLLESMALVNGSATAFYNGRVLRVDTIQNATGAFLVGTNITNNATHLTLSSVTIGSGTYTVNYTREGASLAENVTVEGGEALEILGDWQTIVVIAVVMITIIGLILREFGYLG